MRCGVIFASLYRTEVGTCLRCDARTYTSGTHMYRGRHFASVVYAYTGRYEVSAWSLRTGTYMLHPMSVRRELSTLHLHHLICPTINLESPNQINQAFAFSALFPS